MKKLWSLIVVSVCILSLGAAWAGEFPEKAVKIVVPYGPGGGSDISARLFTKYYRKHLPVDVVVTNLSGGGGRVGETEVFNSRADGYTILWQHEAMAMGFATGRATYTFKDYTPVAIPLSAYNSVVSAKNAPVKDFGELETYVKAHPKKVAWGFSPLTSSHYMFMKISENSAPINLKTVKVIPKNGDRDRIVAMLQGNMMVTNVTSTSAKPYLESGDIRMIGLAAPERIQGTDFKTLKEQGCNAVFGFHYAMLAPKGTPADAVKVLADAVVKTFDDPEFQKDAKKQWLFPMKVVGEDLTDALAAASKEIDDLSVKFGVKK